MTTQKSDNNQPDNNTEKSITLEIAGDKYDTTANKKFERRKPYHPLEPEKIRAFMPGTIQKIYVKPGTKVKEGSKLLILEAMKMKNVLFAPGPGRVKSVNTEVGKMVPKDHILVELELTD